MAIAWCVQLTPIAVRGEICFTETNVVILYGEIATVLVVVFVMQYRRLTEKRINDRRQDEPRGLGHCQILNPWWPVLPAGDSRRLSLLNGLMFLVCGAAGLSRTCCPCHALLSDPRRESGDEEDGYRDHNGHASHLQECPC